MKLGKGKRIAIVAGGACLAVVAVAGYLLRRPITEEWYIQRLASKDEATSLDAARSLGRLGSARAIPALIARWYDQGYGEYSWVQSSNGLSMTRSASRANEVIHGCITEIVSRPTTPVISSLLRVCMQGNVEKRMYAIQLIEDLVSSRAALDDQGVAVRAAVEQALEAVPPDPVTGWKPIFTW